MTLKEANAGFVIVPSEPTPEMIEAGRAAIRAFRESRGEVMDSELAEIAYRAMLDRRQ